MYSKMSRHNMTVVAHRHFIMVIIDMLVCFLSDCRVLYVRPNSKVGISIITYFDIYSGASFLIILNV